MTGGRALLRGSIGPVESTRGCLLRSAALEGAPEQQGAAGQASDVGAKRGAGGGKKQRHGARRRHLDHRPERAPAQGRRREALLDAAERDGGWGRPCPRGRPEDARTAGGGDRIPIGLE